MTRPAIKDKAVLEYVEFIENRLAVFEKSPYAKSYLVLLNQINDFNEQLSIRKSKMMNQDLGREVEVVVGRVDIFGSKDDKEFERSWKFFTDGFTLHEQLDKYRGKMTSEEKKDADNGPKMLEGAAAERHIFGRDGKK